MVTIRKKEGFSGQKSIILPVGVKKKCSLHPIVGSLYITDIGYYPRAQYHYRERRKGVDQNILIYCMEGQGVVSMSGGTITVNSHEYILIPAHTPHVYKAVNSNPWSIYWMHFDGTQATDFVALLTRNNVQYSSLCGFSEERNTIFEKIYSGFESGYTIDNLILGSINLALYLSTFPFYKKYIRDSTNTSDSTESISDRVIAYMRKHINDTVDLAGIAREVNLSIPHISIVFKKATGYSPIQYYIHLKIQRSCEYLQYTNLRINEIAGKIGIPDPYYFSRVFTKTMGLSPTEFRRKHQ